MYTKINLNKHPDIRIVCVHTFSFKGVCWDTYFESRIILNFEISAEKKQTLRPFHHFQYVYISLRGMMCSAQGHPTCFEPLDLLQLRQCCPVVQIQLCNSYVNWQERALVLLKHEAQSFSCVCEPNWQYTVHVLKTRNPLMLVAMDSCTCSQ